jgi:hypothetical protein
VLTYLSYGSPHFPSPRRTAHHHNVLCLHSRIWKLLLKANTLVYRPCPSTPQESHDIRSEPVHSFFYFFIIRVSLSLGIILSQNSLFIGSSIHSNISPTLQCHSIFHLRCQHIQEALSHGTYIIRLYTLVHSLVFDCSRFCYITHCSVFARPWSEARHGRQTKCIFKLAVNRSEVKKIGGCLCVIVL